MKTLRRVVIGILVALVLIQFVPVSRTNPPVESEIQTPQDVESILSRSCYDCHSNKTVWPWYSYVAPVSWLVSSDVSGGRQKLNFTTWNRYTPDQQMKRLRDIWKEVQGGDMPLWYYLIKHSGARLSDEDKTVLRDWTQSAAQPGPGK
jgi:hypothetical protein